MDGKAISLNTKLRDAGVNIGAVVQIDIGVYEDLYKKELEEAFSGDKLYHMTPEIMLREQWLREQVAARRRLTQANLKKLPTHVSQTCDG